jgi:hypothetical protein
VTQRRQVGFYPHTISPQAGLIGATAVTSCSLKYAPEKPVAKAAGIPHEET